MSVKKEFMDILNQLELRVSVEEVFGPKNIIKVCLYIGDDIITEDYCDLPDQEGYYYA